MKNMATCPALLNFWKSWNLSQRYFLQQSSGRYILLSDSLFRSLNIYCNVPKTIIPCEVRSMFSLRHEMAIWTAVDKLQRVNYDMYPKKRISFIYYKGVERLLCSRLTTYNDYGKIFNLNVSIFSLWKFFLGKGLHLEKLRVYNCPWPVWYSWIYSLTMTLAGKHPSSVTLEIKEGKQAKK